MPPLQHRRLFLSSASNYMEKDDKITQLHTCDFQQCNEFKKCSLDALTIDQRFHLQTSHMTLVHNCFHQWLSQLWPQLEEYLKCKEINHNLFKQNYYNRIKNYIYNKTSYKNVTKITFINIPQPASPNLTMKRDTYVLKTWTRAIYIWTASMAIQEKDANRK